MLTTISKATNEGKRFSPYGLKTHRARLGLSPRDYSNSRYHNSGALPARPRHGDALCPSYNLDGWISVTLDTESQPTLLHLGATS